MEGSVENRCRDYEEFVDHTDEARKLAERDRDYYDNKQWTPAEIATLNKRKQPVLTKNRIKPKIDALLGMERNNRTDPKAAPRTPNDEGGAHAATDAIRYVCDSQDFDVKRSRVFKEIAVEGYSAAIVEVEDSKRGPKITVREVPWDRFFYDPHSRFEDFRDARYMGIVVWMDLEEARVRYEGKEDALTVTLQDDQSDTNEDKPRSLWADKRRERVKIIEEYYQRGTEWMRCVFTKGGYLVDPEPSPYTDEDEVPVNPIVAQSCHVDRDNNRYGTVRQLISPQDEVNKRSSKSLHLLSSRQVQAERGAVDHVGKAKEQLQMPDGWLETNPGMQFQVLQTNDMAQGNLVLLQEAKQEMDATGANSQMQGKGGASSGREMQLRMQGGLTEVGPLMDALRQWQRSIYRQIWYRIRQFWTEEKWIRITENENNIKFVGLNQKVSLGEQTITQAKEQGATPEELQQLITQLASDPAARQIVDVENDVARMDLDIVVEDAPDTASLQSEEFAQLVDVMRVNPNLVPAKVLIEASNLRSKKAMLEALEQPQPNPQEQAQMQAQMQMMQLTLQEKLAGIEKTQAETAERQAQAFKDTMDGMLKQLEARMLGQPQQQPMM